jgi:pilus assembly protein CpaB
LLARRLMFAFLAALLVAVPTTIWLGRKVLGHPVAATAEKHYVAAARALDAGELLKPDNLLLIKWPVSDPLSGAFAKPEDVAGRTVLFPLAAGEPVLERDLAAPGSGGGLSGKIPDGMRAIGLKSDEVVGVAGFLFPGTRVDALVTYRDTTRLEPVASIVLQDVQVLAAGHQMQPDPEGKNVSVDVVTLLLTPRDAEKAVLASSQGAIHFVLRNGADRGQTNDSPVGLSQLANAPPMVAAATSTPRLSAPPAAKPYVVETILGTKQSTESF